MRYTTLLVCLVTTCLQVQSAAITKKKSFLSTLENTVKSTLETQLLNELTKEITWKNTPQFYGEIVELIKETEDKMLGDVMRMVLETSNGTGAISLKTIEDVVSTFLKKKANHKRDEDDHMPNYLNIKFGGFGK
ncbi:uncharacterized protein LOC133173659 [Saccostrea echinata]|uniref:uncharacterized protein LOC133173659 n=1 Tax=Saccostrea echinata TaxID=191078 RepID=UPI002A7F07EA|nr:uncharacterized protein LOC133173659 [Saccostrea echinata]